MSEALGLEDLESFCEQGCQAEGCTNEGHTVEKLYLHPQCHLESALEVSYTQGTGLLLFECAECGSEVAAIKLGATKLDG